jgi:hypothetical protein
MGFEPKTIVENSYINAKTLFQEIEIELLYNETLHFAAKELTEIFKKKYKPSKYEREAVSGLLNDIGNKLAPENVRKNLAERVKKIETGWGIFDFGYDRGPVYAVFLEIVQKRKSALDEMTFENAAESGCVDAVKYLLRTQYVNSALPNKNFNNAIEIAARQLNKFITVNDDGKYQRYKSILKSLFLNRRPFTIDMLNNIVKQCRSEYEHLLKKSVEIYEETNQLFNDYVYRLIGSQLSNDQVKKECMKYIAHFSSIKGKINQKGKEKKEKLEGMDPELFLKLHIRSYFELLIEIDSGAKQYSKPNKLYLLQVLKSEILLAMEMLVTYQDIMLIMSNSDPHNVKEDIRDNVREELIRAKAGNIIDLISKLQQNEEYVCLVESQAEPSHCLYVAFTRDGDNIIIRVDNLGEGRFVKTTSNTGYINFRSRHIENKFQDCDLLISLSPLSKQDFKNLRGKSPYAYIIAGDKLYFANKLKQSESPTLIQIYPEGLAELKQQLISIEHINLEENERPIFKEKLSPTFLQTITSITTHTLPQPKLYPYLIGNIAYANLKRNKEFEDYIYQLLFLRMISYNMNSDDVFNKIYATQSRDHSPRLPVTWVAKSPQTVDNCVINNYKVGLHCRINRLGYSRALYKWLIGREPGVVYSISRIKNDDFYQKSSCPST